MIIIIINCKIFRRDEVYHIDWWMLLLYLFCVSLVNSFFCLCNCVIRQREFTILIPSDVFFGFEMDLKFECVLYIWQNIFSRTSWHLMIWSLYSLSKNILHFIFVTKLTSVVPFLLSKLVFFNCWYFYYPKIYFILSS